MQHEGVSNIILLGELQDYTPLGLHNTELDIRIMGCEQMKYTERIENGV